MRHLSSSLTRTVSLAAVVALALAACGGGVSESADTPAVPATSPLTGFLAGTIPNGNRLSGVVLEDGTAIVPYTTSGGVLAGLLHGTIGATAGSFSAPAITDFHWSSSRIASATVSGTYTMQQMTGTVVHSDTGTFGLTLARIAGLGSTATLVDFQGLWTGELAQPGVFWRGGTANIGSDGRVTMQLLGGCAYTGQLTPRAEGGAVVSFTASFQGSGCAGQLAQNGVAYVAEGVLTLATVSANRSTAAVARLRRQ